MPKLDRLDSSDILSICDEYRSDDYLASLDRAELSRHYGGGDLNPDCDDLGLVGNNNWLFGYKYLNRAFQQLFGLYTSDAGILEIKVKHAVTPERRRLVERVANRRVNQVIKESRRFRYQYWSCCGDAVLYGSPYLYRWDKHDWCPLYAGMPLMPRNAPADVSDPTFVRWAFPAELSGTDIMAQLKRASRSNKGRWNIRALKAALKQLTDELNPNKDHLFNFVGNDNSPEEIEYQLQTHQLWDEVLGASVKVYYFFQKAPDGSIDAYIINRLNEQVRAGITGDTAQMSITRGSSRVNDAELFFERGRFKDVKECLFPMTLDVKMGGKALAHRTLGLGRLNYDLDRAVSELMNTAMAGLADDFTPLYQANDPAAMVKLEQMMASGIKRGSVFPPDVQAFEKASNQRNFGNAFGLINMLDVGQGQNAANLGSGGNQAGRARNELEVVALERQAEQQSNLAQRMEDWVDNGLPMAEMIINALAGKGAIVRGDRGWKEKERLEELLAEDGVLLSEIDPALITVRFRRHLGAGDNALRLQRAEKKLQMLQLFAPESQQMIVREWVEALDNSFERANELVPEAPKPNRTQIEAAQIQSSSSLATGIPSRVNGDDIPEIHAVEHLQAIQGVLQVSQQSGLDPSATNGVSALMEHTRADISAIAIKGNEALAENLLQQLQQFAAAAQELATPPPTPKETHDMHMKERNAALQEAKHQWSVEKSTRQQEHREGSAQFQEEAKLKELALKERAQALDEEQAIDQRETVNGGNTAQ